MEKKPRENRIPIMFSEDELVEIDEWRFENRIATRADAVRRLCKIGMVVDSELEQVVDIASDGVKILSDQAADLAAVHRRIVNPSNADLLFGQEEVSDILRLANNHASVAEEGVEGLHSMIVTLYNVISAVVDARTIRKGERESEKYIAAANAAADRASERNKEREDNRLIGLIVMSRTPEDEAIYNALPEEEKDAYLAGRIEALKAEEEADPAAFAERYNIPAPFWERSGWGTRLRRRMEQHPDNNDGAKN